MWNKDTDTISSLITSMTTSGIHVIRVSGEKAGEVFLKLYRTPSGKRRSSLPSSHRMLYGSICYGEEWIDEGYMVFFRGPRSYTAEDTVEIHVHGGIYNTRRLLEVLHEMGIRQAESGEFTKRAFLNGRIDLSEAEGVMELIQAENSYAHKAASSHLRGFLRERVRKIRDILLDETAFLEAAMDDPEHISLEEYSEGLRSRISKIIHDMERWLQQSRQTRFLREGIRTAIIGRPNAGKSTLLNALIGEERAIVTSVPGTTRDTLEEECNLGSFTLRLIDTAGIRHTEELVESIGIERSRRMAEEADLILYLIDGSEGWKEEDAMISSMIRDKKGIVIVSKEDLPSALEEEPWKTALPSWPVYRISAKEGSGLRELEEGIRSLYEGGELKEDAEEFSLNQRQQEAMQEAMDALSEVISGIDAGVPEDLYTVDLIAAIESLGKISGEVLEEDLINRIFSKFCLGK